MTNLGLFDVVNRIKLRGTYDIKINSWNWNCEVWSHLGVRTHEFDAESELIAFLRGVYYTLVDYE